MKITKTHNQANLASKKENKTLQAGYPLYAFDTDGIKDSNEPFSVIELLLLFNYSVKVEKAGTSYSQLPEAV